MKRASIVFFLLSSGCAHKGPFVWVTDLAADDESLSAGIQARDTILVETRDQPTMSGEFIVRDDGHFAMPMVGSLHVAGLPPVQAAALVRSRLTGLVVKPDVAVWVAKTAPIRVKVVGQVRTPGSFELVRERGVLGALAAAGWLTDFADKDGIFVLRTGDRTRVRFRLPDLTTADAQGVRYKLRDGDAVIVE